MSWTNLRATDTSNATLNSGNSATRVAGSTEVDWSLSQAQWGNFTYYFCALVLPVVCVVGLLENALSIWALVRIGPSGSIGPTSRLYYMALAALELGNLIVYYLVNLFGTTRVYLKCVLYSSELVLRPGDYGLHFITNGAFYWVWETSPRTAWVCHLFKACFFYFPHIINWTYLLLNVERFCAVTFPLHTKRWFTVHSNLYYLALFSITGIPARNLLVSLNIYSTAGVCFIN